MKKIESFQVDHRTLLPGIYVSRKDQVGAETVTTFDVRMKKPNKEPVIDNPSLHALEHLGATYLRNNEDWKERVIYFGPMGCRTGFYLVMAGNMESKDISNLVTDMFEWISKYEGDIPGQSEIECGNYLDLNLPMAIFEANEYLKTLHNLQLENLKYQ